MPITKESKIILKKEFELMQKDKVKYQQELNTINRDLGRGQTHKKEVEDQIKEIDRRSKQMKKDMDGQ